MCLFSIKVVPILAAQINKNLLYTKKESLPVMFAAQSINPTTQINIYFAVKINNTSASRNLAAHFSKSLFIFK
jgi:hypothetical protein